MRKLALAFLFCSYCSIANAQTPIKTDKPIVCFPVAMLLDSLQNTFKEEPVFVGKHSIYENMVTAVYINTTTGTYTVIEMDKTTGCVISIGSESRLRVPKLGTSI